MEPRTAIVPVLLPNGSIGGLLPSGSVLWKALIQRALRQIK